MARALIRLRTQFDIGPAGSAVATPSGACCSCCCCCAASLIATSGYTAFSLGRLAKHAAAYSATAGLGVGTAVAAGALVMPVAVLAGLIAGAAADSVFPIGFSLLFPLLAWGTALALLHRRVGAAHPIGRAVAIVVLALVAFWVEFVGGLVAADVLEAYLVGGVVLGIALVVVEYLVIFHRA